MSRFPSLQTEIYRAGVGGETPSLPITAEGLERSAREVLPARVFDYVAGAAGIELTARANRAAFSAWEIVPRQLRGARDRDLSIELLGLELPAPVILAPVGGLGAVRPGGELEVARAASSLGLPMTLSTLSEATLEVVASELAASHGVGWFQLYWPADRELALSLVERAERAGYRALVVTVDTWALAWRPRDLANGYLPFLAGEGLANYLSDPVFRSRLPAPPERDPAAAVQLWSELFGNPELSWADLEWLRGQTGLPILVKGVCHPDDARAAAAAGLAGVIVSNHGGRQLDGARPALECLPEVAAAAGGLTVLFDSGIRTGADIAKALALGARAVLVGRPYVYGLALAGAEGVSHVLRCLLAELDITVALSGNAGVGSLGPELLVRRPDPPEAGA